MELLHGDCLETLKGMPDESVDAVVSDPPYELGFMGKHWDASGIAYNVDLWKEVMRVLKPGGHLIAFGGTRTYHRMAVAIEDAGFEVRDMLEWIYASGFPKSLNVGKAVDKLQGNEREVVGEKKQPLMANHYGKGLHLERPVKKLKDTKGNSAWEGFGTALKPAHETVLLAQKPLDSRSDIDYTVDICQTLFAQLVKNSSEFNLSEKTQQSIAQFCAEEPPKVENFSEAMDILRSGQDTNMNLNIVLSWLKVLKGVWRVLNTYTTKMEINLTTDLKILKSLEWENIFQNITLVNDKVIDGNNVDVVTAGAIFNAVKLKLNYILTHSADAPVISKEVANSQGVVGKVPNHEPIILARKPLEEKTIVENVLKWGCGGLDIDGCRIPTSENNHRHNKPYSNDRTYNSGNWKEYVTGSDNGRFPANIIVTDDALNDGVMTKTGSIRPYVQKTRKGVCYGVQPEIREANHTGDSGSKSRYFDIDVWAEKHGLLQFPKASKRERNEGLDCTLTVKYNTSICKKENTVAVQLLEKVTYGTETLSFSIDESGESITAQCHRDSLSTILTETNRIIESKTLNSLQHFITNGFTQGANSEVKIGINPAESVESLNQYLRNTTNGNQESARGVSSAVLQMLLKIKDAENWKPATNSHATVKPIHLMSWLIRLVSKEGDTVLDPFMGSGTTGVACKKLNRDFIGIEMSEEYIKIAEARIAAAKLSTPSLF